MIDDDKGNSHNIQDFDRKAVHNDEASLRNIKLIANSTCCRSISVNNLMVWENRLQ